MLYAILKARGSAYLFALCSSLLCLSIAWAEAVVTYAGGGVGDGGLATAAQLQSPYGIAADALGNVYVADGYNHRIRKIASDGVISTVAGTGIIGFSGDGGPAVSARLYSPSAVAVDEAGNLYIADSGNNVIRKVDVRGVITTVAGDPNNIAAVYLSQPSGIAVDKAGNLYIADTLNSVIRKVSATGVVSTVAGMAKNAGYSGDGGLATAARLFRPNGVAVDGAGTLYIADSCNNVVRSINSDGIIHSVAGTDRFYYGGHSLAGCPFAGFLANYPSSVSVDVAGNLYVPDARAGIISKYDRQGNVSIIAGMSAYCINDTDTTRKKCYRGDGAMATSALLSLPGAAAVGVNGTLYIADSGNGVIRKVDQAGIIHTLAGDGTWGYRGDGGPRLAAAMSLPNGIFIDRQRNMYIADSANNRVRKITPDGLITTVAGNGEAGYMGDGGLATAAQLHSPSSVLLNAEGQLVIVDAGNHALRAVDGKGIITTIVGNGQSGYLGDGGPAVAARLSLPYDAVFDTLGTLYISDTDNNAIRKVTPGGIITTIAGNGQAGHGGDGGPATAAQLELPKAIRIDLLGNLYIVDAGRFIRKIDVSGLITTYAGNQQLGQVGDDGIALTAKLDYVRFMAMDPGGSLYFTTLRSLRRISKEGVLSTIIGERNIGNGQYLESLASNPGGIALDDLGNIYFSELETNLIRKFYPGVVASVAANGPLSRQTLRGDLAPESGDLGKPGNEFVAAITPAGDLFLLGRQGWHAYDPQNPIAYASGPLAPLALDLTSQLDLSSLLGTTLYLGYGRGTGVMDSFADMMSNAHYSKSYIIQ